MAENAFLVRLSVVLTASGTGRMAYPVSAGETLKIHRIRQKSTGAFDVYGIGSSDGTQYSNAAAGATLDSDFFYDVATPNSFDDLLPIPIIVEGNSTFFIDVIDTSVAGNTVEFELIASRTYEKR